MKNSQPAVTTNTPGFLRKIRNILILYNRPVNNLTPAEELTEADTFDEVNQVKKVIDNFGIGTTVFGLDENNIEELLSIKTDFIFNLCYGIGSLPGTEADIYKILDKMGIPYTGGSGEAVGLTNNKSKTKELFLRNGLPTPAFMTVSSLEEIGKPKLKYPLLVKTRDLGCSLGMDMNSVVTDISGLKEKVLSLLNQFHLPVLIEEYIEGREFSLFLLGNGNSIKVFPLVEVVFGKIFSKNHRWRIFDFEAKWDQNSPYCKQTPYVGNIEINQILENKIREISLKAFKLTGAHDYARLDLRVDSGNNPFILEVNLNPSIGHGSQVDTGIKAAGWNFEKLILGIISISLKRHYGSMNDRL